MAKSRRGALFHCAVLFSTPFVVCGAAVFAGQGRAAPWPESWLRMGRYSLAGLGLYMFAAAFLLEWAFKRSADMLRARGHDPEFLILRSAVACAVVPSVAALFVYFVGASVETVFVWSAISVLAAGFWFLRYRHVLIKGR